MIGADASRVIDARAKRLEREMDREAEELVNRGDARFIVAMDAAVVKARMKQVPTRLTRNLEEREPLKGIIAEGLDQASAEVAGKLDDLENGRDEQE